MITIIDQPYRYTPIGQKLMVVCSSTNSANSGFRYVFRFAGITGINDFDVLVQPNGSGVGILDLCPLFREYVKMSLEHYLQNSGVQDLLTMRPTITEGWLVDGVFTQDIGSQVSLDTVNLFNAEYEVSDGYKPDTSSYFNLNSPYAYLLSERYNTTHQWSRANEFGLTNQNVYIPVHYSDGGLIISQTANAFISNTIENFVIEQFDASNTLVQTNTISVDPTYNRVQYIGIYPSNLSGGYGLDPSTIYYKFYGVNSIGEPCTRIYIYYLVDDDCRYDNVRLGWSNRRGGYDYFNFTKKSELTYNYERKQYQKVIGSYNASTFEFNYSDRSLTDRRTNVTKGLSITSDWITKGEYELLNSLLSSNDVWIISGSSQTPVSIDSSNFTIKDSQQDGKLYNVTLNLKYSQPQGI